MGSPPIVTNKTPNPLMQNNFACRKLEVGLPQALPPGAFRLEPERGRPSIDAQKCQWNRLNDMATPAGLEPATNSLEGCCSIRLSYGAVVRKGNKFKMISRSMVTGPRACRNEYSAEPPGFAKMPGKGPDRTTAGRRGTRDAGRRPHHGRRGGVVGAAIGESLPTTC
jgi:hypothetical protein